jgi:hypothetical protein
MLRDQQRDDEPADDVPAFPEVSVEARAATLRGLPPVGKRFAEDLLNVYADFPPECLLLVRVLAYAVARLARLQEKPKADVRQVHAETMVVLALLRGLRLAD